MILDSCPSSYNCLSFALVFLDCFIKKTCQIKFFSDRLAQSEVMWFNVLDFNNVLGHYSNLYIYYLVLIFIPKWLVKIILNVENHSSYVCMRPSLKWNKIKNVYVTTKTNTNNTEQQIFVWKHRKTTIADILDTSNSIQKPL